jgi:hypothetical protein
MKPKSLPRRIWDEAAMAVKRPIYWMMLSSVVPGLLLTELVTLKHKPRLENHDHLTASQSLISKPIYRVRGFPQGFEDDSSIDGHMEALDDNIDDFDTFRNDIWKYVTFWYRPKSSASDDGIGMKTYEQICKGEAGSCTEAAFAFWTNMRQIAEDPETGDKFQHYILLVTYEKSDLSKTAGHALYLGERIKKDGSKKYFLGGINPFEDPNVEYDSVEDAIEANTNHFRLYAYENLHSNENSKGDRVMIRPQRWAKVHPKKDLGVDIVHSDSKLNVRIAGQDPRESREIALQRKFMKFHNDHGVDYMEPYAKVEK